MADKDFIERETFRSVFPHSSLLICRFHVLKIFRREITVEKMGMTSSQRNAALELIQKLVYSRTEEDYEEGYKEKEDMCPSGVIGYIKKATGMELKKNGCQVILGLDLFNASLCSMRWALSYYRQKMRLLTTDKSVEGHVICSTVKEKNGPLSEHQKYRKASVITNQLASLCAEVSMVEYKKRIEQLNQLLTSWRSLGNSIISDTSVSEDILSGCDQPGFANRTADNSTPISANILHEQDNHEADQINGRKDGQNAGKITNATTVILQGQTDPICRPSTSRINNETDSDAPDATVIQEYLFKIADKAAVIRAERGSSKIDEDEVQVIWQDLIPYAELILNLTTQAHAKQYFTYEGWSTVESTIRILEDQHLKRIKAQEYLLKKEKVGKTSKNNQDISNMKRKNSDTSNPNSVKNKQTKKPRIDKKNLKKIFINTRNMEKEIKDFIIRGGHTKSLPKIGNPVSAVEDYIDKTRKLTEEQRTILATFLCNSYKEISYRTPDVASLIHNIITFVLEFNETDIAEERIHLEVDTENIRKTCSSDDGTENLQPIVPTDIKYPPKLSRKGRPEGSEKTVIGITKK
ncbi:unnamed protein product [Mytilus coruscus]|uniref:MULE transposase domain-containing protein n=1 Tax=Mytilus coruscus TaxID=42192 RepID=A0A6J8DGR5_MYTCO|nr:unnamed protein product [Mytilus coruscus]